MSIVLQRFLVSQPARWSQSVGQQGCVRQDGPHAERTKMGSAEHACGWGGGELASPIPGSTSEWAVLWSYFAYLDKVCVRETTESICLWEQLTGTAKNCQTMKSTVKAQININSKNTIRGSFYCCLDANRKNIKKFTRRTMGFGFGLHLLIMSLNASWAKPPDWLTQLLFFTKIQIELWTRCCAQNRAAMLPVRHNASNSDLRWRLHISLT